MCALGCGAPTGAFVRVLPAALGRRGLDSECPFSVGTGRPSRRSEGRKPVIGGPACVDPLRAPSLGGELVAQDRRKVLPLAQQPDHIQRVSAFEVAPEQRELCNPPGPKPWNAEAPSERRRADARVEFDLVKRGVRCPGHRHRHAAATLFAVIPDLALLVAQRLRAKNRRLQSISPRAIATSSFSSALVRRQQGPDASPSSMRSRSRFLAYSS